jgi:hypothetical protein
MHKGGFYRIFLILAAISFLFDWYVFKGLRTLTNNWQSAAARNIVCWGFLIISASVTIVFLVGFGSFSTARGMLPFHEWMFSLFLTFFFYQTCICTRTVSGRSESRHCRHL